MNQFADQDPGLPGNSELSGQLFHHERASPSPPPLLLQPQLLYDGQDAEAVALLSRIRHLTLIHIHPPYASPADRAKFELWGAAAAATANRQWAGQPGNFELMVKQG